MLQVQNCLIISASGSGGALQAPPSGVRDSTKAFFTFYSLKFFKSG